jgi:hypothetical protein
MSLKQGGNTHGHFLLSVLGGEHGGAVVAGKTRCRGSSSNASSQQIKGYIDELNSFLGRFLAWRPSAARLKLEGHEAFSQKLEGLIERIQYNLQTYNHTYSSRSAFERFQHQQTSAAWPGAPYGVPSSGGPERFQALMGMRCYWCGRDLGGLPQPVAICPRCGRFPTPPST